MDGYLASMGFLLLSILFNVFLGIVFRCYPIYGVQNLPAIVVNYLVCVGIAILFTQQMPWTPFEAQTSWAPYAVLVGSLLMGGFWIASLTVQHYGVGTTSVFQKTSLVITAIFAIIYFGETVTPGKVVGIPIALVAIYLINRRSVRKEMKEGSLPLLILLLPLLTFGMNALIDTTFFYVEEMSLADSGDMFFISALFFVAACIGLIILIWQISWGKLRPTFKDLIGGIALGVPNFFSIHFFLCALGSGLGGSVVVPINNVGIILVSALAGAAFFAEKFNRIKIVGIFAAIIAILLLGIF